MAAGKKYKPPKKTRELLILQCALAMREYNRKVGKELLKLAYLYHGYFNTYFTTASITEKRFIHKDHMYMRTYVYEMEEEGLIKRVAGEGKQATVYTLTEKGKERAALFCKKLGMHVKLLTP